MSDIPWYDQPRPPKPLSEQRYDDLVKVLLEKHGITGLDLAVIKDMITDYRLEILREAAE